MDTYTISYSTALRNWILARGNEVIIHADSSLFGCFQYMGAKIPYTQDTKVVIMVDGIKKIEPIIPDLAPYENSAHGRASRAALSSYGEILREHGQYNYADQIKEIVEEADSLIRLAEEVVNNTGFN